MSASRVLLHVWIGCYLIFLLMCSSCSNRNPYLDEQEKLAAKFGVRIDDFHSPMAFPIGYYDMILKPGMEREEVHRAIQDYEKVLQCWELSEIYYYFSEDDMKAIRIKVVYDETGHFRFLEGEEPDSRTIRTGGCVPGLLK